MSKKPATRESANQEPSSPMETNRARDENDVEMSSKKRATIFEGKKSSDKEFVESFIKLLLSCKGIAMHLKKMEIFRIIHICKKIFAEQGRMLEFEPPVKICGDLHGQYADLIRLFNTCGFPPWTNYLFLGDYVDRGDRSLDCILLLLAFKARWPDNFFLLRGNHELKHVNEKYGFREEIHTRLPDMAENIYEEFCGMMDEMPLTALVGNRILCMHGGISPYLKSLNMLREVETTWDADKDCLENDVLWTDPSMASGWTKNPRGASYCYGEDVVKKVCGELNIDLVVRGHQVVEDGYELFADKHLVTVFSAPHYMGSFTNSAAVCNVSAGLEVTFEVLKPLAIPIDGAEKKMMEKEERTDHMEQLSNLSPTNSTCKKVGEETSFSKE